MYLNGAGQNHLSNGEQTLPLLKLVVGNLCYTRAGVFLANCKRA